MAMFPGTDQVNQDITQVKGMKITLGFVALADRVSDEDAIVVQTLREAGAVVYVKTTMPQTGMVRFPTRKNYKLKGKERASRVLTLFCETVGLGDYF